VIVFSLQFLPTVNLCRKKMIFMCNTSHINEDIKIQMCVNFHKENSFPELYINYQEDNLCYCGLA
jgi:hypothetical protein